MTGCLDALGKEARGTGDWLAVADVVEEVIEELLAMDPAHCTLPQVYAPGCAGRAARGRGGGGPGGG
jgi:hypothetical protein